MEDEAELPSAPPKFLKPNLSRPININHPDSIHLSRSFYTNSTCSNSSTSSTSTSPPELVRHVQAAFKRQRNAAQGIMQQQSNGIRPRRFLVPQQTTPKEPNTKPPSVSKGRSNNVEKQVDASITAPTGWGSTVNSHEESFKPFTSNNAAAGNDLAQVQKKVHFAAGTIERITRVDDDMLSHMDSLALTETECVQGDGMNQDWQHQNFQSMEMDNNLRTSEGGILAVKQIGSNQVQLEQFDNFLRNDLNNGMTQSSVVGSSCVTSTLINRSSAPMVSSTTYCSQPCTGEHNMGTEPAELAEVKPDIVDPSHSLPANAAESMDVNKLSSLSKESQSRLPQENDISKTSSPEDNNSHKGNVTDIKRNPNVPLSDATLENSKSGKPERSTSDKAASIPRKRGYDPDLFFKVNGKLYQRLGKIGSGGSSEVHKVISSDCKIYALKKIKLKGRDYATAFGFCQEIEYLNRLRGMDNIIQLIDYEVTDKRLHQEVLNGTMSNKDGRVRDDGYIYMVLEYGEIDLAHMLSHKWKELDGSNATIDENWLRFYWQQILLAVNTIHEERIVHSDLKPANFLLVRGALKLIDFGIAKAIMSDTTNIQRDSQVGTLSYMSPEAFMCNETDANGNTIKCGRPSDIWSLGCILYQMVYGRTPFSEYKTFWAKFKVITNPNHEIVYEPVSNPWLLDLMKKCLAWDRNERWRIPQLLQHPFLVPPIPSQLPEQGCNLFQLIAEFGKTDQKTLVLCSQLQNMIKDPKPSAQLDSSMSIEQMRKMLCKISNTCFQLQEQLANIETEASNR